MNADSWYFKVLKSIDEVKIMLATLALMGFLAGFCASELIHDHSGRGQTMFMAGCVAVFICACWAGADDLLHIINRQRRTIDSRIIDNKRRTSQ